MGRPHGCRQAGARRALPADARRPRRRRQRRGPVLGRDRRRDGARDQPVRRFRRRSRPTATASPTPPSCAGRPPSPRLRRSGSTTAPGSSGRSAAPLPAGRGRCAGTGGRPRRREAARRDVPRPDHRPGRAPATGGRSGSRSRIDRTAGWLRWAPSAFYPQDLDALARTARASFRLTRARDDDARRSSTGTGPSSGPSGPPARRRPGPSAGRGTAAPARRRWSRRAPTRSCSRRRSAAGTTVLRRAIVVDAFAIVAVGDEAQGRAGP